MKGHFYSLYKPVGVSSFKALGELKKKYDTRKVGHLGTLDPLAEGVLAVAVGEATKLIPYVVTEPKVYECEIYFGLSTPTLDREGLDLHDLPVLEQSFSEGELEGALQHFVGEIDQVPPKFSAVHVNGERAYKLARKGEEVKIKSRKVECFDLNLIYFDWPVAKIQLSVGNGFYVRSLVRDLALELDSEAFMLSLKRLSVGEFKNEGEMEVEKVLVEHDRVDLNEEEFKKIRNGIKINNNDDYQGLVLAYYKEELVAILESVEDGKMLKVIRNLL